MKNNNGWINLNEKIILVTGGSSGIGARISQMLHRNNAVVVICDLNEADNWRDYASLFIKADITSPDAVNKLVAEVISRYGKIDCLVNNAGVNRPRLMYDFYGKNSTYQATEADFDFIVAVNQKAPFLCTQAVLPAMIKQNSGTIINVSSEAGTEGSAGQSIYSATKGALNSFTRSWAKEYGRFNIRVVGIAPGINKRTNMNSDENYKALAYTRGKQFDHIDDDYTGVIPLGRAGEHHEIADLICYLASDHASYISGTTINISGGKSR
ncbi:sorbitol-6-phosphate 2-dehydrogenase [Izhakiella australiensis]|uniref:Sorbitol-6-phosphate 2-dehydrogenase n=1 Tax=Izhakiella australiensis TaxID=1926881 RepID=A0A1S8YPU3_9GAMM|nr:sorbitol-6-phosphate dehydrogenase subunit [Izhakiella australiensis]OON41090.1 sorbitol-6-phosphate 2-dehydrogenase [Izhakiella australiensis]